MRPHTLGRTRRHRPIALVIAPVVLALALGGSGPVRGAGGGDVITTLAGSVGSGPASSTAFAPRGLALRGDELIVADIAWDVIRSVDLATGQTRVLAGTGFEGAGGDGVATQVHLKDPYGVAVDRQGAVYFTEPSLHRVRRLGTDNRLTTVAGTGTAGYSGDGGPATAAALNWPIDVAVDIAGNVHISDSNNMRVRRIAVDGTITTIAGTGEQGFSGDGGPATLARFDTPEGLAADTAGNLFVVDQQLGRRVRRITAAGIVTTVAGGGAGTEPSGPATALALDISRDVEPDGSGGFYVSGIYSVTHVSQGWATRFAGNGYWPERRGEPNGDGGPATAAQVWSPEGLARSSAGHVYIADYGNSRIRRVAGDGTISSVAGTGDPWTGGDGGPASRGQLERPGSLEFDGRGSLLFNDNSFIRAVRPDGTLATLVGHPHRWPCPSDGAVPRSVDACAGAADGTADGRLYFVQPQGFRVWVVGLDGLIHPFAGTGERGSGGDGGAALATPLDYPVDIEVAPSGDVYFLEYGGTAGSRVRRVDQAGVITTVAGGGADTSGEGVDARAAALAATSFDLGADGSIYVVEMDLHRVRRIGTDGRIRTVAGTGRRGRGEDGVAATSSDLNDPRHVAVAPDGTFFVSDSANHRVRRVGPDGVITTVAGRGSAGFSGDGAAATNAELNYPMGVAVGGDGSLFVADMMNRRIRRVAPAPADGGGDSTAGTGSGGGAGTGSAPGASTRSGYWMLDAAGSVYAFGDATYYGGARPRTEAVDIEPTPAGRGYWILEAGGTVHGLGEATPLGPAPVLALGERATSLSATPSGAGYWIFTTAGRVFPYGDATSHGDMAGRALNAPVLDSVPTPNGGGYYMVAADGGIFAFGNARFAGSMGGRRLNAPVQSLVPDRDGAGYWLVASDGGSFAFDAAFRGSLGSIRLNRPITGMVRFGNGYLMVGEDGGIFNFSDRAFHGSLGDRPPARAITSVAVLEGLISPGTSG